jgi:ATP synthase F1 delta subunit
MFTSIIRRASAKNFLIPQAARFMSNTPVVESTEDHQAHSSDESISGRYASVLFTAASRGESLHKVYEDMEFISGLYNHAEDFRILTQDSGLSVKQIKVLNDALSEVGDIQPLTSRFIEVLCENKRLVDLNIISTKYQKYYKDLNREEKITITSAEELDEGKKDDVLSALKANPDNEGKQFILEFKVDNTIKGGLIMYTESEYMDLSLSSRINRIRQEVSTL